MTSEKLNRCPWCGEDLVYLKYHDEEWGRLVKDDHQLFECLVLESAQAGLSWVPILRRREGYRDAFLGFDVEKVAAMNNQDVDRLMNHPGIIRNRRKIVSTISNARHFMEVQREFGSFHNYFRSFFKVEIPVVNHPKKIADIAVTSTESDAISKDMHRRGFRFFGSTLCYAFLQSIGFVMTTLTGASSKNWIQYNIKTVIK